MLELEETHGLWDCESLMHSLNSSINMNAAPVFFHSVFLDQLDNDARGDCVPVCLFRRFGLVWLDLA